MNSYQRVEKLRAAAVFPKMDENISEQYERMRLESIRLNEEKQRKDRIQQAMKEIPALFRHKTFDDFNVQYFGQRKVKDIAYRFVDTFPERLNVGTNLLFLGHPGTGKTLLSLIMYQALSRMGYTVRYESSLQFLRTFREKNFESSAAFESLIQQYLKIKFLIIDEVTESRVAANVSHWEKEMLFALMDARYSTQELCTVFISNRTKEETIERLGERTVGRLMQNSVLLGFDWNSYRQK